MAEIVKQEENNEQRIEQSDALYVCGCDFAGHGSTDISITCVMKIKDGVITIESMDKYPELSKYAVERNKQITAIQKDIASKYPGVQFLKENK